MRPGRQPGQGRLPLTFSTLGTRDMTLKIGINGFGRIGRLALRAAWDWPDVAFVHVNDPGGVRFDGRAHFFGIFARAMDQFIVDWQRARHRQKRGGGRGAGALTGNEAACDALAEGGIGMNEHSPEFRWKVLEALAELGNHAPLAADVVWLRYGHGLSIDETSRELGIAPRTVCKYWNFARAWLRRRLDKGDGPGGSDGDRPAPVPGPGAGPDGSSPRTPAPDAVSSLPQPD